MAAAAREITVTVRMMKLRFIRIRHTSIRDSLSSEGTIVARARAIWPACDSGWGSMVIYTPALAFEPVHIAIAAPTPGFVPDRTEFMLRHPPERKRASECQSRDRGDAIANPRRAAHSARLRSTIPPLGEQIFTRSQYSERRPATTHPLSARLKGTP